MNNDTTHRDNIVCPNCGYEDKDSWEVLFDGLEGDVEVDCDSCGKPMWVSKHVSITYSTEKVDMSDRTIEFGDRLMVERKEAK